MFSNDDVHPAIAYFILGSLALLAILAVGTTKSEHKTLVAPKPTIVRETAPAMPVAAPRFITRQQFATLRNGMSYSQVVEILGMEGELMSQNRMEGVQGVMESVETVMYQWTNPGVFNGNMNAMFQNDRLISKAQFGLR